jgi:hypothetical protein
MQKVDQDVVSDLNAQLVTAHSNHSVKRVEEAKALQVRLVEEELEQDRAIAARYKELKFM